MKHFQCPKCFVIMLEDESQHLTCPKCGHYSNKVFVAFFTLRKPKEDVEVAGFQYELVPLQQKPPVACIGNCQVCRYCDGK